MSEGQEAQIEQVETPAPEAAKAVKPEASLEDLKAQLEKKEKDLSKGFSILGNREKELQAKLTEIESLEKQVNDLKKYQQLDPFLQSLFSGDRDQFRHAVQYAADQAGVSIEDVIKAYAEEIEGNPNIPVMSNMQKYISKLEAKLAEIENKVVARESDLTKREQEAYAKTFEDLFNSVAGELNPGKVEGITQRAISIVQLNTVNGRGKADLKEEFTEAFNQAVKEFESYYQYKSGQKNKKQEEETKQAKKATTLAGKPGSAVSDKKIKSLDDAKVAFEKKLRESKTAE